MPKKKRSRKKTKIKKRSPIGVILLSLCTFGIYAFIWLVKTKNELNSLKAEIPTAWLLIFPIVHFYWHWKYSKGVEKISKKKIGAFKLFLLMNFQTPVGQYVVQKELNKRAK